MELHKLAEWSPESAPVDFQDWLLVLQPQMADLSASSGDWWTKVIDVCLVDRVVEEETGRQGLHGCRTSARDGAGSKRRGDSLGAGLR